MTDAQWDTIFGFMNYHIRYTVDKQVTILNLVSTDKKQHGANLLWFCSVNRAGPLEKIQKTRKANNT
jgi:hypothetical protein